MDLIFYGFAVLMFAAVILAIEGGYLWWSDAYGGSAQRIARRLRVMSGGPGGAGERISILKQRHYSSSAGTERLLQRLPWVAAIDRLMLQAGLKWTVAQFLGVSIALFAFALMLLRLGHVPTLAAPVLVLTITLIPYGLLMRARAARLYELGLQLPEAADFIGRALRAGHSFTNVLQMVGAELPEPISGELRSAQEEINYGVPMNEALHNLAVRVPLTDLRYLVIAVLIQRESGGNLAEVMENISRMIRARLKLVAQVRVLSAEGRLSAWVLGLLPLVMLVVLSIINPRYVRVLWTDPAGISLLWSGAAMIVFGTLWMRIVIRIRI